MHTYICIGRALIVDYIHCAITMCFGKKIPFRDWFKWTLLPVSNMSIDQSHFDRRALEGFNKSPKGSNVHWLRGQICVADRATVPLLPFSLNWVNHQKRTGPPQSPWFMTPHYMTPSWACDSALDPIIKGTAEPCTKYTHQWILTTVRAHVNVGFIQRFSFAAGKST